RPRRGERRAEAARERRRERHSRQARAGAPLRAGGGAGDAACRRSTARGQLERAGVERAALARRHPPRRRHRRQCRRSHPSGGGTGAKADDPTEGGVGRAEKGLAANDLAGAVKAVEAVNGRATGPAQSAVAPWLAAARERVTAETALAMISQQLTARLTAGGE